MIDSVTTHVSTNNNKEPMIIKMNEAYEIRPGFRIPALKKGQLQDIDEKVEKIKSEMENNNDIEP